MTWDSGVEGGTSGISGGAPVRGGPPWGTRVGPLMNFVLFPPPDAVLLDCEFQRDKACGLDYVFS